MIFKAIITLALAVCFAAASDSSSQKATRVPDDFNLMGELVTSDARFISFLSKKIKTYHFAKDSIDANKIPKTMKWKYSATVKALQSASGNVCMQAVSGVIKPAKCNPKDSSQLFDLYNIPKSLLYVIRNVKTGLCMKSVDPVGSEVSLVKCNQDDKSQVISFFTAHNPDPSLKAPPAQF